MKPSFAREAFGAEVCPFLVSTIIKHHLQKILQSELAKISGSHWEKLIEVIVRNIYADNVVIELYGKVEAHKAYETSKQILSSASFSLRE